jgi:hypothetical protein
MTPPVKARGPEFIVESAETPEADADRLIASFRIRAYSEARLRQRQARTDETVAHWGAVASVIARRARERPGAEPSTGKKLDAGRGDGSESLRASASSRFFEVDPVDELERILAAGPQCFRLQFFGLGPDLGPALVTETEIQASDASGAIRAAAEAAWPPQAVGLRVLDLDGREIFERLKADRR